MQDGNDAQVEEYNLWQRIMQTYIGVDVNLGLGKDAMAAGLLKVRLRAVIALLAANGVWILLLSTLYMTATQQQTKINVYGVISGIVYGFSFTVQLIGMTVYRVQDTFQKLALWMSGDDYPVWIIRNRRNAKQTQCTSNGGK